MNGRFRPLSAGGTILLAGVIFLRLFTFSAFAEVKDENVYHCHANSSMKIALTFDDGPHPQNTEEILRVLEKYGVPATFFLVGENVVRYPELVGEILRGGHEIGNHTFSHYDVGKGSVCKIREEIEQCEEAIYEVSEYRPKLFRPPGGVFDRKAEELSANLGMSVILWNVDTRDWAHTPPEIIEKNVLENVKPGSIILMHDYISHGSPTAEALERFLPELLDEGYHFVVVSELIGSV